MWPVALCSLLDTPCTARARSARLRGNLQWLQSPKTDILITFYLVAQSTPGTCFSKGHKLISDQTNPQGPVQLWPLFDKFFWNLVFKVSLLSDMWSTSAGSECNPLIWRHFAQICGTRWALRKILFRHSQDLTFELHVLGRGYITHFQGFFITLSSFFSRAC